MCKLTEYFDFLNRDPAEFRGLSQSQFCRFYYSHIQWTPEMKDLRRQLKLYDDKTE